MIKDAIAKVVEGKDLDGTEAEQTMNEIMSGEATDAQIAALITALRIKGETVTEVTGFAKIMRQFSSKIKPASRVVLDTCGTGGDVSGTINISTAAAFIAAAAGLTVAKHGNRSVSSRCGSADVLEELGINVTMSPELVEAAISEVGIGFLFAPVFHPAMKYAIGPRREIGIRTVFNILGPLTNPAMATHQVLGVYSADLLEFMAGVLRGLGTQRALVVHGDAGLDELSTTGKNRVAELDQGQIKLFEIDPGELGLATARIEQLKGGSASENATAIKSIFQGEEGPHRDVVLLNAAAAIYISEKVPDMTAGLDLARQIIDSGSALAKLEALASFSRRHTSKEDS